MSGHATCNAHGMHDGRPYLQGLVADGALLREQQIIVSGSRVFALPDLIGRSARCKDKKASLPP